MEKKPSSAPETARSPWSIERAVKFFGQRLLGGKETPGSHSKWPLNGFRGWKETSNLGNQRVTRWWQLKHFVFSSLWFLGKWSNLANIFQMGWFNHQLYVPTWRMGSQDGRVHEYVEDGFTPHLISEVLPFTTRPTQSLGDGNYPWLLTIYKYLDGPPDRHPNISLRRTVFDGYDFLGSKWHRTSGGAIYFSMILSWIFLVDEWMIFLCSIYLEPFHVTCIFVGGTRPFFGALQAKEIRGIRLVLRTAWQDILRLLTHDLVYAPQD